MTDTYAVARLKAGDLTGLEELINRYQDKAVRVVFMIVQDEPLAEDIVIDTFLRIANRIDQFNLGEPFEPYLMRSLIYASLNAQRKKTIPLDGHQTAEKFEQLLVQAESIEDKVEANDLRREIQDAISTLTPRQRAAIVQRYYLGMSEQEMSSVLDAPRGTVKWLLNQARGNLRELLSGKRIER